jgi:hypothetical protein
MIASLAFGDGVDRRLDAVLIPACPSGLGKCNYEGIARDGLHPTGGRSAITPVLQVQLHSLNLLVRLRLRICIPLAGVDDGAGHEQCECGEYAGSGRHAGLLCGSVKPGF